MNEQTERALNAIRVRLELVRLIHSKGEISVNALEICMTDVPYLLELVGSLNRRLQERQKGGSEE